MTRLLFIFILILAGITDAVTRKIPDLFPALITILALSRFLSEPAALATGIPGLFALSVPMLLLTVLRSGLGGGDIKLTAACGLFLGTDALLTGVFLASLSALFALSLRRICLGAHTNKRRSCRRYVKKHLFLQDTFAFGPYLALGFIVASLAG